MADSTAIRAFAGNISSSFLKTLLSGKKAPSPGSKTTQAVCVAGQGWGMQGSSRKPGLAIHPLKAVTPVAGVIAALEKTKVLLGILPNQRR